MSNKTPSDEPEMNRGETDTTNETEDDSGQAGERDFNVSRRQTLTGLGTAAGVGAMGSASAADVSILGNSASEVSAGGNVTVLDIDLESDDQVIDVTGGSALDADGDGAGDDYDAVDNSIHPTPSPTQEVIPGDPIANFDLRDRVFTTAFSEFDRTEDALWQSAFLGNETGTLLFTDHYLPLGHAASFTRFAISDFLDDDFDDPDVDRTDRVESSSEGISSPAPSEDGSAPQACPSIDPCNQEVDLADSRYALTKDLSSVINPQLAVKVDSIGIGQDGGSISGISLPYTALDAANDDILPINAFDGSSISGTRAEDVLEEVVLVDEDGNVPDLHSSDANGYQVTFAGDTIEIEFFDHREDVTLPNAGYITEVETDSCPGEPYENGEPYESTARTDDNGTSPDEFTPSDETSGLTHASGVGLSTDFNNRLQPGVIVELDDGTPLIADRHRNDEPMLNGATGFVDVVSNETVPGSELEGSQLEQQRVDQTQPILDVRNADYPVKSAANGYIQLPVNSDGFTQNSFERNDALLVQKVNQDTGSDTPLRAVLPKGGLDAETRVDETAPDNEWNPRYGEVDEEKCIPNGLVDNEYEGVISASNALRKLDWDPEVRDTGQSVKIKIGGEDEDPTPLVLAGGADGDPSSRAHILLTAPFGGRNATDPDDDGTGTPQARGSELVDFVDTDDTIGGSNSAGVDDVEGELEISRDPRVEYSIAPTNSSSLDGTTLEFTENGTPYIDPDADDTGVIVEVTATWGIIGDDGDENSNRPVHPECDDACRTESVSVTAEIANESVWEPVEGTLVVDQPPGIDVTGSGGEFTADNRLPVGEEIKLLATAQFENDGDTRRVDITDYGGVDVSYSSNDTTVAEVSQTGLISVGYTSQDRSATVTVEAELDDTTPGADTNEVTGTTATYYYLEGVAATNSDVYSDDRNTIRLAVDNDDNPNTFGIDNTATVDDLSLDTPEKIAQALEDGINTAIADQRHEPSVSVFYDPDFHPANGYVVASDTLVNSSFEQNVDHSSVEIAAFESLVEENIFEDEFNVEEGVEDLASLERQNVACALGFCDEEVDGEFLEWNNVIADVVSYDDGIITDYEARSDPLNETTRARASLEGGTCFSREFLGDFELTCNLEIPDDLGAEAEGLLGTEELDVGAEDSVIVFYPHDNTYTIPGFDDNAALPPGEETFPNQCVAHGREGTGEEGEPRRVEYEGRFIEGFDIVEIRDSIFNNASDADSPEDAPDTLIRENEPDGVFDGDGRTLDSSNTVAHAFYGDRFDGLTVRNTGSANMQDNIREHELYVANDPYWITAAQALDIAGEDQSPAFPQSRPDLAVFYGTTELTCGEGESEEEYYIFTDDTGKEIWFGEDGETTCGTAVEDNVVLGVDAELSAEAEDGRTLEYEIPALYDEDNDGNYDAVRPGAEDEDKSASFQDRGIFFESHDDQGHPNPDLKGDTITIGSDSGGGSTPTPTPTPGDGGDGGSTPTPTPTPEPGSPVCEQYAPTGSTDVSNSGLINAINDWRADDISNSELVDVINCWRNT